MSRDEALRIIPLGGLGEIGKNMMLIELGDSIIIVDAGMMFPDHQMFGIDLVIPDFSYVLERKESIKAVFLTHGHEDHIGALPYLLKNINVPVYGTKLTLGFAKNRLEEYPLHGKPKFMQIHPRHKLKLGSITAEFFRVCHSVADGIGIAFHTPFGVILHSGDFKIDFTPINNEHIDFHKIAELGERGILLLMADSTNAENAGYTPSESKLNTLFLEAITGSEGKVLVATFASNIHRIQQIFDICSEVNKRIAVIGRSMEKNISMAKDLGYLHFHDSMLISPEKVKNYKKRDVVILTTGTQGEPMSALARIADRRYKSLEIEKGDTVILSASIIPGNERTVAAIVNSLFREGASVYYEGFEDLHVSGHASQEELKLMLALAKPRYFMPIHGEFRHLVHHSNLAKQFGINEKNIIVEEDGDVVTIDKKGISITDHVPAQHVYIDGKHTADIESYVLRERHRLSEDGIVIIVISLSLEESSYMSPEIFSRGFLYASHEEDLFQEAKDMVMEIVKNQIREKNYDLVELRNGVRSVLKSYFLKKTSQTPMIVPIIIEV
jgi:ribonuclease J